MLTSQPRPASCTNEPERRRTIEPERHYTDEPKTCCTNEPEHCGIVHVQELLGFVS
jgi:hypothetical protein